MKNDEQKNRVILFLGFNGVTHPSTGSTPFHKDCMYWLEKLISRNPFISIVISSSWRQNHTIEEIKKKLGKVLGSRVVGVTPEVDGLTLKSVRNQEIDQYLKDTNQNNKKWVGLDVVPYIYNSNAPVIYTDPSVGFNEDNYFEMVKKLLIILLRKD